MSSGPGDMTLTSTTNLSAKHAEWFENERGILPETLEHFGVFSRGEDIILPYSNGEKTRPMRPNADRRFFFTKDVKPWLYHVEDAGKQFVFLVEGETDAMRLWQELGEQGREKSGVVALSGVNTWQDGMAEALSNAQRVYIVLDNDEDYLVKAQVERAWEGIQQALGSKVRRLYLPGEVKDVCQFFKFYDLDALGEIIKTAKAGKLHYKSFDFSKPMSPTRWMVESQIAQGDIVLLQGEPNVGKSFLTMNLCIAVAQGWQSFLGYKMSGVPGRVLYVDEENPEDVVHQRMRQLGLMSHGHENIRYLWEQGVRLDRDPHKLLDEAKAFEPDLIVIDSLTRIHTQDENSNGAMSKMANDGIKPLARATGATVVVLHHTNKGDGTSSMKRTRGAADINAVIDTGFDVLPVELGDGEAMNLLLYKTRRGRRGRYTTFRIVDVGDRVELQTIHEPEPPF
jgi:hypothetical protein